MLTPAQQKIRRELEELQLKGLLHEKDEHLVHKRRTKMAWLFISLAALLLVSPLLTRSFFKTSGPVRVNQYLLEVYQLDQESSTLLGNKAVSSEQKGKSGSDIAGLADLKKLQSLVDKAKKLKAPRGLEDYQQDLIAVLEQRVITLKAPSKRNLVTLDVKKGLARDSLVKALEMEKVKYRVLEDDTIQFWIDAKIYQY